MLTLIIVSGPSTLRYYRHCTNINGLRGSSENYFSRGTGQRPTTLKSISVSLYQVYTESLATATYQVSTISDMESSSAPAIQHFTAFIFHILSVFLHMFELSLVSASLVIRGCSHFPTVCDDFLFLMEHRRKNSMTSFGQRHEITLVTVA